MRVLLKGGALSQSRLDGFVEMLQRGFVPTEKDLILGTGMEPALNALRQREVLFLHCRHQQIHVAVPMTPGAFRVGRFRGVERNIHDALVGRIAEWINVPSLEMVALHDEDSVGKKHVNDRAIGNKIPFRFRQLTQFPMVLRAAIMRRLRPNASKVPILV